MEDYKIVKVPDEKINGLYEINFFGKNGKEKSLIEVLNENLKDFIDSRTSEREKENSESN
ncbi:MAG: hypothetical protein KKB62_01135 [Nanoarchaeota archaeon]|nr:hypothetical protein [Nanoarchaeota archaeon]